MLWSSQHLNPSMEWQRLKGDVKTQVYRAQSDQFGEVIVKQFVLSSVLKRLRFTQRCKALQQFYASIDVSMPALLGVGYDAHRKLGECVYAVVPGVDLRQVKFDELGFDACKQLFAQVGELVNDLHQAGWVHGDLKFGNILFDGNTSAIYVIDLESVSRPRVGVLSKRGRDLARFILNALENNSPIEAVERFWLSASEGTNTADMRALKIKTKHWLEVFCVRHEKHYQGERRALTLSECMFLE